MSNQWVFLAISLVLLEVAAEGRVLDQNQSKKILLLNLYSIETTSHEMKAASGYDVVS